MNWTAQETKTRTNIELSSEKAQELDKAKQEGLPVIQKESEGTKPFEPIKFQPVRSPGIYEAEFGVKGKDLIFHFWPYGYHQAEKEGIRTPNFHRHFAEELPQAMKVSFNLAQVETKRDEDMGAIFVKVNGAGENQFFHELAVKVCEELHRLLGGDV